MDHQGSHIILFIIYYEIVLTVGSKVPCAKKKSSISNDFPAYENKIGKGSLLLILSKEPQVAGARHIKKEDEARMWLGRK